MEALAFIGGMIIGGVVGIMYTAIVCSSKKTRPGIWRYIGRSVDSNELCVECSQCGFTVAEDFSNIFSYCPCCGTHMMRAEHLRKEDIGCVLGKQREDKHDR